MFAVGAVLNPFIQVCAEHDVTPIILHHTKQTIKPGRYCTLSDLSWAGFEQIARQWITLNRKTEYEVSSGKHELLCGFGGSMGHNSNLEILVDEGVDHDAWSVELEVSTTALADELYAWLCEQEEPVSQRQIATNIGNPKIAGKTLSKLVRSLEKAQKIMTYERISKTGQETETYRAITDALSESDADEED